MRYFGTSPNKMFFLLILLAAIVMTCTSSSPLFLLQQQFTNAIQSPKDYMEAPEMPV